MTPLHELREQMRELVPTLGHVLSPSGFGKLVTIQALDVFRILDAFEAAHPKLVDLETVTTADLSLLGYTVRICTKGDSCTKEGP